MLNLLTELGPILAFFIGYTNSGLVKATFYMFFTSVISLLITYFLEKKINMTKVISFGLLFISVSFTLISGNSIFIKIKPTLLYSVFALISLVTSFKHQPLVKLIFGKFLFLKNEEKWRQLNIRFMFFFILMAILNEIVWRNFSEKTWVNFKVFACLPISLVFFLTQVPFIIRNKKTDTCECYPQG